MRVRIRVLFALLALALLVACVPAGASGGAGARSAEGAREPAAQPPFTVKVGGSVTAPDPEGGRPWTLRARTVGNGMVCSTVRRQGGRRVWRVSCLEPPTPLQPIYLGVSGFGDRTIVSGVIGPGVTNVELTGIVTRPVRVSRRAGIYLAVLPGAVRVDDLGARFTFRDGHTQSLGGRTTARVQPLDPVSGERWTLSVHGRQAPNGSLQTCTTFETHDGSRTTPPLPRDNTACAELRVTPFAVAIGPFAGRNAAAPPEPRTLRTLAFGVVGPRVAAVGLVVGDAPPRRLELTDEGRAFLAILPPDVIPSTVQVVLTFADGTTQTVDRSTGVQAAWRRR